MTGDAFEVVLRGYDRFQVEQFLAEADAAVASSDERLRSSMRKELESTDFTIVLRGYDRALVDAAVQARLAALGPAPAAPPVHPAPAAFRVVLRGYDRIQVDTALAQAAEATRSDEAAIRYAARKTLRATIFAVRFRGYDRAQVDHAVAEAVHRLS